MIPSSLQFTCAQSFISETIFDHWGVKYCSHPPCSPDLAVCDFLALSIVKHIKSFLFSVYVNLLSFASSLINDTDLTMYSKVTTIQPIIVDGWSFWYIFCLKLIDLERTNNFVSSDELSISIFKIFTEIQTIFGTWLSWIKIWRK